MSDDNDTKELSLKERTKRLDEAVLALCEHLSDNEYSWQKWADPLHLFIKELKDNRETNNERALTGAAIADKMQWREHRYKSKRIMKALAIKPNNKE